MSTVLVVIVYFDMLTISPTVLDLLFYKETRREGQLKFKLFYLLLFKYLEDNLITKITLKK